MNEKHIEDLITSLYDMVQDARALPLAADKCILERDKALDLLDEIIAQLPAELKQSRTIVESRNELIGQARREAENIIHRAREEAEMLVSQQAIYQEAKRQCTELVEETKSQIDQLQQASNEYMEDALRRTEEAIMQSLGEVQETRAKFQVLINKEPVEAMYFSIIQITHHRSGENDLLIVRGHVAVGIENIRTAPITEAPLARLVTRDETKLGVLFKIVDISAHIVIIFREDGRVAVVLIKLIGHFDDGASPAARAAAASDIRRGVLDVTADGVLTVGNVLQPFFV